MIVRSRSPLNTEPHLARLRAAPRTAQSDFYVRCHGNIPALDAKSYRLHIDGLVRTELHLSLADLQARFAPRTVIAVLQCAGNRRADLQPVGNTTGDPWAAGAIGNAAWTGVALADLLQEAGAAAAPELHVAFACHDTVEAPGEGRFTYGASIPLEKALRPEVLLAWAMGGAPLAPAHGFPLRAMVPGFAGVRSPKWLARVTVQDHPSENPMQQRDYKLLPPDVTAETVDWQSGLTINEMPLNAAICEPAADAVLAAGRIELRGYAVATGRDVVRVDVSSDGGRSWRQARLAHDPAEPWSWTLWSAKLDLAPGEHELAVRAWDSAGQTQPAHAADTWNFKGYLSAAWHRVPITVR